MTFNNKINNKNKKKIFNKLNIYKNKNKNDVVFKIYKKKNELNSERL